MPNVTTGETGSQSVSSEVKEWHNTSSKERLIPERVDLTVPQFGYGIKSADGAEIQGTLEVLSRRRCSAQKATFFPM